LDNIPEFEYGKRIPYLGAPWCVGYKKNKPIFHVNPEYFDRDFFDKLRSEDVNKKDAGLGYFMFALVHDIIHLYQTKNLMKGKRFWLFNGYKYLRWLEGLAQLHTFKICDKMQSEADKEDYSVLESRLEEGIVDLLKSKKYKKSVAKTNAQYLAKDTIILRKIGELEKDRFSFSNYPFEISDEVKGYVDIYVNDKDFIHNKRQFSRIGVRLGNAYIWGAYQLSKVIEKGEYTFEELVEEMVDSDCPSKNNENN